MKLRYSERMSRGDLVFKRVLSKANRLFWSIYMHRIRQKTSASFSKKLKKTLDELELDENCGVIIGGDFNVILDAGLDGTGGKPHKKECCKTLRICIHHLI